MHAGGHGDGGGEVRGDDGLLEGCLTSCSCPAAGCTPCQSKLPALPCSHLLLGLISSKRFTALLQVTTLQCCVLIVQCYAGRVAPSNVAL